MSPVWTPIMTFWSLAIAAGDSLSRPGMPPIPPGIPPGMPPMPPPPSPPLLACLSASSCSALLAAAALSFALARSFSLSNSRIAASCFCSSAIQGLISVSVSCAASL
jgi:hypothetical protein